MTPWAHRTDPTGRHDPEPGRGTREPGHPRRSRDKWAEHGTGPGNAGGHKPHGTALPAPWASGPRAAPPTPAVGGGVVARTPRVSERTHTHQARGADPSGMPDRACRTRRPHGMGYQQASKRDTQTGQPATSTPQGAQGGGETQAGGWENRQWPPFPVLPRAPRTHEQGTAPAKAVDAHSAKPQLRG